MHTIFQAFDCNPTLDVRSVYLDISKAFDRVCHVGRIYKLKRCGVSGRFLSLVQSFLKDRKQRTVLNEQCSNCRDVLAGVPQGSILGPLLFLVYINDLTASVKHETSISDHYMVYCVRKFRGASRRQHKNISTTPVKNFNSANFINDLLSIDWNGIVNNNDDVNLIVEQWTSSFSQILEKHAPLRERRVSEKLCPWLTKDLKLMSAARDKLKKQAVRSNSEILMQAHRQMRNKVNKLNTESKREYFSNKIASHNGDLKNTRKIIDLVLNKKSKATQIP